jgi:hypothetical protein
MATEISDYLIAKSEAHLRRAERRIRRSAGHGRAVGVAGARQGPSLRSIAIFRETGRAFERLAAMVALFGIS